MTVIAAFYHFFDFPQFEAHKEPLKAAMNAHGIKGSLLISPEGINATISGTRGGIDAYMAHLEKLVGGPITRKESSNDGQPFQRAKVRLKKETISLGEAVDITQVGEYVEPEAWNALINEPGTIILDTRNDYEVHLGTFEGAIDPKIPTFKQLPEFVRAQLAQHKDAKIATFCTGGIRCEKFTAWMKTEGFEKVYHLKGGILKYLEEIPEAESKWQGECYVFDDRIAVGHGVAPSQTASQCARCGWPLTPEDRAHPAYVTNESCRACAHLPKGQAANAKSPKRRP
ncbi:MAG: rhodanese-related sulfurtransferase [Rickettsiales bacterium]|nr:rhodanese-related sulfurtransferase [Rickettsiales bacterium]